MADLAANIGANFSNYVGNAALGGEVDFGVLNIDTKPIEDLGRYTMIYNKAEKEQKQKEAEAQAKQLADITAYDLTTAIPKERELIQKKYNELYEYARANPTVLDYKNNQKGWLEYNKKKNDFENDLRYAKMNSIMALKRQQDIENAPTAELKSFYQKKYDDEIANKDLYTPIRVTEQFDLKPVQLTDPGQIKVDQTSIDPNTNENIEVTYAFKDVGAARRQARMKALGIDDLALNVNDPGFLSKTPEEQKRLVDQYAAQKAGNKLLAAEQAAAFNAAWKQYGGDLDKMKRANPMLAGVVKTLEDTNNYLEDKKRKIDTGIFRDKGQVLQFGSKGLDSYDYQSINYQDGEVTTDDILFTQILGLAPSDSYDTKVTETDNKLQQDQLKQKTINDADNRAIERAKIAQAEKHWKASQDASEEVSNNAWSFAQQKYAELEKLAVNGIITPDKIRQIPSDILKYLGTEQPAVPAEYDPKTGEKIKDAVPAGFRPLDFGDQTDTDKRQKYAIGLDNGKITVLKVNEDRSTKSENNLRGVFDNAKSTSIDNIANIRVKEELKVAGPKELNVFRGLDDKKKGATVNKIGSTKSSSGASSSSSSVGGYTNITETNVGTIGVKDGKWYNIKTGKPL